jgi:hypothetical protein
VRRGGIFDGRLANGAFLDQPVGSSTAASVFIDAIAGSGDTSAPDAFLVTSAPGASTADQRLYGSRLTHFDGVAWTTLGVFTPRNVTHVVRLGPGEAMAISLSSAKVLHAKDGAVTEEQPSPIGVPLQSIAFVPGFGPVAGDQSDGVYRFVDGAWVQLQDPGFAFQAIEAIAPYEDGFVVGSGCAMHQCGSIAQYRPQNGFCPRIQAASHAIASLLVFGKDVVVVQTNGCDPHTVLNVLRRLPD